MNATNKEALDQLAQILTITPQQYVDALLALHDKLDDKKVKWVISGNLAECLRTVKVKPECIEIITSKIGAEQICQAVQELKPQQISFQTQRLPRNVVIEQKDYPVYTRSHYFEFNLNGLVVKVHGDLQYKVGDWDWGDIFDFNPEYVYVAGKKTAVTPLSVQYQLCHALGWTDRAEKILQVTKKPLP